MASIEFTHTNTHNAKASSGYGAKLTASQVKDIRSAYDESVEKGLPPPVGMLANKYNVSISLVWRVARRRSYRDVK